VQCRIRELQFCSSGWKFTARSGRPPTRQYGSVHSGAKRLQRRKRDACAQRKYRQASITVQRANARVITACPRVLQAGTLAPATRQLGSGRHGEPGGRRPGGQPRSLCRRVQLASTSSATLHNQDAWRSAWTPASYAPCSQTCLRLALWEEEWALRRQDKRDAYPGREVVRGNLFHMRADAGGANLPLPAAPLPVELLRNEATLHTRMTSRPSHDSRRLSVGDIRSVRRSLVPRVPYFWGWCHNAPSL
jgi:hypothetical protein